MIDRYITMKTEEQAKRYAKELNSMPGVWGACTDGQKVIVSYTNANAEEAGDRKFYEIYDED